MDGLDEVRFSGFAAQRDPEGYRDRETGVANLAPVSGFRPLASAAEILPAYLKFERLARSFKVRLASLRLVESVKLPPSHPRPRIYLSMHSLIHLSDIQSKFN